MCLYCFRRYPTWAESQWKETGARMFLKADPATERAVFFVGAIVAVLAFAAVYWAERNADHIFKPADDDGAGDGSGGGSNGGNGVSSTNTEPVAL